MIISILISLSSCGQKIQKLEKSDVDQAKIELAEKFTNDFFHKSSLGDTMIFADRTTNEMGKTFNPENQMTLYNQFISQLGNYNGSEFVEAWHVKNLQEYVVYRFFGKFDKIASKIEIRVALDKDNLIAGYYIIPWKDAFK